MKSLTVLTGMSGVLVSLLQSAKDGYNHWARRFLYFTAQSNIWIGSVCLLLLFAPLFPLGERALHRVYVLKYVFTVSILITGLVFCTLLAPFAPESYHLLTFTGYLTHVFSPAFAVADFFVDDYPLRLQKRHLFYSVVPPLFYFLSTMLFSGLKVDFGRGEYYPYYFLNFRSPAGFFGFSGEAPFFLGSFYWVVLFTGLVLFLAFALAKLRGRIRFR